MSTLHLLIIADDPLVRGSLATLLQSETEIELVGQTDSHDVLADLELYQPQVILWDLGWSPTVTADLAEVANRLPVVILLADSSYAAEVWALGVHGLLPRNVKIRQLTTTLSATQQGLAVLDPQLRASLMPLFLPPNLGGTEGGMPEPLTPRELEVLQLLAEGLPNKLIAPRLAISDHTVKFHVNAILGKLNAQSRTEAVVKATRLGLVLL